MLVTIISNVKMLYYNRIDISEGVDVNKRSESEERLSLLVFSE